MEEMRRVSSVLLTGNAGYIGTVMTKFLKERSHKVVGFDAGFFAGNYLFPVPADYAPDGQIIKDIRDISAGDLDGIDGVIHLAALSNDPLGEINPELTGKINFESTIRLAKLCKEKGVKRFLFASSCSIYGISGNDTPISEKGALSPMTAYARAKVRAEEGLAGLADNDFHPVFMRNATVYGLSPRLRLDLVVNNLLAWAYLTGEAAIMSDGKPWRPIIHIEDFCAAFAAALIAPFGKIHCEAFNVGTDEENYQVKEIAEEVCKAVPGSETKIRNNTGPDERSYRVDFSKIKSILTDFRPRRRLKEGIMELLEAYKRYGLTSEDFNSDKYFRIRTIRSLLKEGKIDNNFYITGGKK
jgi:nucleoside-diphosphate-sugar epimerase